MIPTHILVIIISVAVVIAFFIGYDAGRSGAVQARARTAIKTLRRMGYEWRGGDEWLPPTERGIPYVRGFNHPPPSQRPPKRPEPLPRGLFAAWQYDKPPEPEPPTSFG